MRAPMNGWPSFSVGRDGIVFACHRGMIKKLGRKWVLYDSKGERVLGRHDTKQDAQRQERAIQISKARQAGHHIPPAPR